mmetsp:Transcript_165345/g.525437  ORF Transcript_165345/g.525437 Transcript_165345/m.525437 type:complete len:372 (+) Transcript_165345:76-1191(+)
MLAATYSSGRAAAAPLPQASGRAPGLRPLPASPGCGSLGSEAPLVVFGALLVTVAAARRRRSARGPAAVAMSARKKGGASGGSSTDQKAFRNPHNLPTKPCVTCNRPFTWRKKWEKCWDEVLTCSNRCKTERKTSSRKAGAADGADDDDDKDDEDDEEEADEGEAKESTKPRSAAGASLQAAVREGRPPAAPPRSQQATEGVRAGPDHSEEVDPEQRRDEDELASEDKEPDGELSKADARRVHKLAVKAEKEERRARRSGSPEAIAAKRKPCDICERPVDLLVRCTCDASGKWRMLCGRCWTVASGGVPDGDADHPHYRYGGLWKNRAAKNLSTPSFGQAAKDGGKRMGAKDDAKDFLASVGALDSSAQGG